MTRPSPCVVRTLATVACWALGLAAAASEIAPPCPTSVSEEARAEAVALAREAADAAAGGNWSAAETALDRAAALDPGAFAHHYGLGQVYMATQRYAEAAQAFAKSRALFGCLSSSTIEERRRARRILDEQISAVSRAIQAMEKDRLRTGSIAGQDVNRSTPAPVAAGRRAIAELEKRLGDLRQWRKSLDPGAKVPASLSMALGGAHFQLGALADAEREFQRAADAEPGNGDADNNLAVVFMLQGRLEAAEQAMKKAQKKGSAVSPRLEDEIRARRAAAAPPPS